MFAPEREDAVRDTLLDVIESYGRAAEGSLGALGIDKERATEIAERYVSLLQRQYSTRLDSSTRMRAVATVRHGILTGSVSTAHDVAQLLVDRLGTEGGQRQKNEEAIEPL